VVAVLVFLDHSFEMLLKACIIAKGGTIRDRGEKNTIGFDACVRRALSDGNAKFLTQEQALVLQTINGLRYAAQHHLLDISEGHVYLQAQSGVTLFGDLLKKVFKEDLSAYPPDRALPVATIPPTDAITLFEDEVSEVAKLLSPHKRRRTEAEARLRGLAIVDGALQGEKLQPGESDLRKLGRRVAAGEPLEKVFPGLAAVQFTTEGSGPTLKLRISKKEGIPVQLVPEGTPGATVVALKRVDELGFYNLGHNDLAKQVALTPNKTTAIVWFLKLQDDPDCFKEVKIGKSTFKRYSQNAIKRIRAYLDSTDIDDIWKAYRSR
jgi:hypothetical protein